MRITLALLAFAVLLPADSFAQDHFQDDTGYEGCLDPDLFDYSDYPRDIRRNKSTLYERSRRSGVRFYGYLPPSSHPNVQWFMRLRNNSPEVRTPHIALFNDAGGLVQEARIGVESRTVRGINSASMRNLTSDEGHKEHDAFVSHLPEPGPNQLLWARVQIPRYLHANLFLRILSGDGKGFLSPIRPIGSIPHNGGASLDLENINPASNHIAVGIVRLVNPANGLLEFTIGGRDDLNAGGEYYDGGGESKMTCEIDACSALTLTAQQLERGTDACSGNFGDGSGKWRILGYHPRKPVWAPWGYIHYSGGVRNSALGLYSDYQGVYSGY